MATFEVLKDLTKCHMNEEETAVFHVAKVTMRETQLNDLGMRFKQAESAIPSYTGAMSGTTGTMMGSTTGNTGTASGGATVGTP